MPAAQNQNPWPHRTAWLLACATFPLIWMGGLVTTYDAGMAVPDWPNTYGYNLFLYPLESWLREFNDLFLEHSHRLIGAAVGTITIVLAALLWRKDERRWMRWLGVAAIVGVIFQGVLGGLRVVADEVVLADVHGCTAPLFFALTTALVAFTSPRWKDGTPAAVHPGARTLRRATTVVAGLVYLQIVLGAQLRHLSASGGPGWFLLWVWLHLIVGGLVVAGVVWLVIYVPRRARGARPLVLRARLLGLALLVQFTLGLLTWVVNFGFPQWFRDYIWAVPYTVVREGWQQIVTTTAHVAFGSLTLAGAVSLALWCTRLLCDEPGRKRG